jgi:hypothetical protein
MGHTRREFARGRHAATPILTRAAARAARCHVPTRREFLSAWRHVSCMAGGAAIRDEYAAFLMSHAPATVRRTLEALAVDVSGLLTVMQSEDARRAFKEQTTGIEGAWPCVAQRG